MTLIGSAETSHCYSIADIERAINTFCRIDKASDLVLGKRVRCLADIYGLMIYSKFETITRNELNADQQKYLDEAFGVSSGK